MGLQGFDSPRPAPRVPTGGQKRNGLQKDTREKRSGILSAAQLPGPPKSKPEAIPAERKKGPYLNVITNFSNPHQERSVETEKRGHERNESIQARRLKARKSSSKSRVENLRTQEPVSGLSPSDRELVIGLTIPGPPLSKPKLHTVTQGKHQSKTPEIVITPADTKSSWNSPPITELRNRRRAVSSVYSRYPNGQTSPSTAPPVPRLERHSNATSIETSSRCTSWATDFSDDDTLNREASRPESRHSHGVVVRGDSADTIAARYQSRGWWNHVISPFLDRAGTMKSMRFPNEVATPPQEDFKAGNWKIVKKPRRQSNVHSIWADLTGRSIAPKVDKFFKEESDPTYNHYPGVHRGQLVFSPGQISEHSPTIATSNEPIAEKTRELNEEAPRGMDFVGMQSPPVGGVQGMGLAAEYFEAYWHDQSSPTPYFKCQNHVCVWGSRDGRGLRTLSAAKDNEDDGNQKSIDAAEDPFRSKPLDESADQATRFGGAIAQDALKDALSKPTPSHSREISESTDIEDGFDEMPATSTAKAVTMTRAKSSLPVGTVHGIPSAAQKELPYPPDSPNNRGLLSPDALTPGLRSEYNANRALPMDMPYVAVADSEPQPRYPPVASFPEEPRSLAEAHIFRPQPLPDRFAPQGVAYRENCGNVFTYKLDSDPVSEESHRPMPLNSNPMNFREKGVFVEELNDSHPDKLMSRTLPAPSEAHRGRGTTEETPSKNEKKSKLVAVMKSLLSSRREKSPVKDKKKRRRLFCCIFFALFLMVLAVVLPVIFMTLPRQDMSVETSWLNISGYPPIPTGIATIIRPNSKSVDGCVEPPTMWSCAVPKEQQASIAPNKPDQPNFRVEIRFENGTNLTSNSTFSKRSESKALNIFQFLGRNVISARDSFTSSLFQPSPAPPSEEDQAFLGNTTDNNTQPFSGEATPFFISILDAEQLSSSSRRLRKRQFNTNNGNQTNATDPFPDLGNDIPAPDINEDGTAAAAELYPLPTAQPVMLYNRGQPDEHYGFYTYFDRSIFLKSASVENLTTIGVVPDDENGGAFENAASLRCTWAQTRFLVQIWTNTQGAAKLLSNATANDPSSTRDLPAISTTTSSQAIPTQSAVEGDNSSANDFVVPGSFPLPVTVTMDRHGGDINLKSIYCYGMDDRERIISSEKKFQLEDRSFGGTLANPASGLFSQVNVSLADGGPGGIDGGNGGCSCQWQNFETT